MGKALMVNHVRITDHAEIFNGKHCNFPLAQLIHAGTLCEDGNPQILPDQILDGRHIIHLNDHIEIRNALIDAFQCGLKKCPGSRSRAAENQIFLFQLLQPDHRMLCQRIIGRKHAHQIIRIQRQRIERRIGVSPLYDCNVNLKIFQLFIKIFYGIRINYLSILDFS